MTIAINTVLELTSAALGLAGLIAALWAMRAVRAIGGWPARCLAAESNLAALRRELEHVASIGMKTGQRLQRIEQEYSGVAERVDQVEVRGAAPSFDRAIDSARRGADTSKLAQQFGLSLGEADLVARLHGRKKSA
jgi:hypothetical protein